MIKNGLDYFPLSAHPDDAEELIVYHYGYEGSYVWISLMRKICSDNGYFMLWNKRSAELMSRKVGIDFDRLDTMVKDFVEFEAFDPRLFADFGILTNRSIQECFFTATARRKELNVIPEYVIDKSFIDELNVKKVESEVGKVESEVKKVESEVKKVECDLKKVENEVSDGSDKQSKEKESEAKESEAKQVKEKEIKINQSKQERESDPSIKEKKTDGDKEYRLPTRDGKEFLIDGYMIDGYKNMLDGDDVDFALACLKKKFADPSKRIPYSDLPQYIGNTLKNACHSRTAAAASASPDG